jgi:hypothetical protein
MSFLVYPRFVTVLEQIVCMYVCMYVCIQF